MKLKSAEIKDRPLGNLLGAYMSEWMQTLDLPNDKVNKRDLFSIITKDSEEQIKIFMLDLIHTSKNEADLVKKVKAL